MLFRSHVGTLAMSVTLLSEHDTVCGLRRVTDLDVCAAKGWPLLFL